MTETPGGNVPSGKLVSTRKLLTLLVACSKNVEPLREIIWNNKFLNDRDAGFARMVYYFEPNRPFRTCSGVECRTLEEIGNAIEVETAYYKSVLIDNSQADLYIYLEERGLRDTAYHLREIVRQHGKEADAAFYRILLALQGMSTLRIGNKDFQDVNDILRANISIKEGIARSLANESSKLAIWVCERYPSLRRNVEKWRQLGRHNALTLAYALQQDSPFRFENVEVRNQVEFRETFFKLTTEGSFLDNTKDLQLFVREADFWLRNYHQAELTDILIDSLKRITVRILADGMGARIANCLVIMIVDSNLVGGIRIGRSPDNYWPRMKPLFKEAIERGFIRVSGLENMIRFVPLSQGEQKEYIERIRSLDSLNEHVRIHDEEVDNIIGSHLMPPGIKNDFLSADNIRYLRTRKLYEDGLLISKTDYDQLSMKFVLPDWMIEGLRGDKVSIYFDAHKNLKEIISKGLLVEKSVFHSLDTYFLSEKVKIWLKTGDLPKYENTAKFLQELIGSNCLLRRAEYSRLKKKYFIPKTIRKDLKSTDTSLYRNAVTLLSSEAMETFGKKKHLLMTPAFSAIGGIIGYLAASYLNKSYNPILDIQYYSPVIFVLWLLASFGLLRSAFVLWQPTKKLSKLGLASSTVFAILFFFIGTIWCGIKISEAHDIFKYRYNSYVGEFFDITNQSNIKEFSFGSVIESKDKLKVQKSSGELDISASFLVCKKTYWGYSPLWNGIPVANRIYAYCFWTTWPPENDYRPVCISFEARSRLDEKTVGRFGLYVLDHLILFNAEKVYLYGSVKEDPNYAIVVHDPWKNEKTVPENRIIRSDSRASLEAQLLASSRITNWSIEKNKIEIIVYPAKVLVKVNDKLAMSEERTLSFIKPVERGGRRVALVAELSAAFGISPVQVGKLSVTADEKLIISGRIPLIAKSKESIRMTKVFRNTKKQTKMFLNKDNEATSVIIPKGEKIEILKEDGNYWKVRYENQFGYCIRNDLG